MYCCNRSAQRPIVVDLRPIFLLCAIGALLSPSAAIAGDNAEPRLPNPQWRTVPHSGSSGEEAQPSTAEPPAGALQAPLPPALLPVRPASFEERCAQSGVVLCDPLDKGRVRGAGVTSKTPNATLPEAMNGHYRDWRVCGRLGGTTQTPVLDEKIKTSGSGALKFIVPTRSGAGDGGYCEINFTPDNSVQFGEGETFFVQFRVRLSCTLLFTDCEPTSPGYKKTRRVYRSSDQDKTNFKVSIINAGNHRDLDEPVGSCTAQHLVLIEYTNGIITGYHSCGWYDGHYRLIGHERGSGLWDYQPKRPGDPGGPCSDRNPEDAILNCVLWPADEWVTITQQVTIGAWVTELRDPARTSNVRIWMQRKGQAPVLVINYDRNLRAPEKPFMKYGKIWLLPYMTNKDPLEEHPEAYMWFDELIVSREPIAPALD